MKNSLKESRKSSPEEGSEEEAVKTTIVGGRPPVPGRQQDNIPRGIEVLIKKASVDPAFGKLLLEKRAEAAHEIALELSPPEAAALNAVPPAQLEKIIANTTVPDPQRRAFLGYTGAAMLAALTLGLSGCGPQPTPMGIRPEDVTPLGIRPTETPRMIRETVVLGIQPTVVVTVKPTSAPTPTPTPIRDRPERLDVKVKDEGADWATVVVSYDCAFETGEITVDLRQHPDFPGVGITYQPAQPVAVPRGSGEVTLRASGSGTTTYWLVAGLRATTVGCQNSPVWPPPGEHESGQTIVGGCAVWKFVEYRKNWSSTE